MYHVRDLWRTVLLKVVKKVIPFLFNILSKVFSSKCLITVRVVSHIHPGEDWMGTGGVHLA